MHLRKLYFDEAQGGSLGQFTLPGAALSLTAPQSVMTGEYPRGQIVLGMGPMDNTILVEKSHLTVPWREFVSENGFTLYASPTGIILSGGGYLDTYLPFRSALYKGRTDGPIITFSDPAGNLSISFPFELLTAQIVKASVALTGTYTAKMIDVILAPDCQELLDP